MLAARRMMTRARNYWPAVLADTPYAYWRLNEASGNFADHSGNGFTGVANGGISYRAPGLVAEHDSAVTLDGSTGYFDNSVMTPMHTGTVLSVEAWVAPSSGGAVAFIANDDPVTQNFGFFLGHDGTAYVFAIATNAGVVVASCTHALDTTHAHYFAGTFDGRYATLYRDGSSVATGDAGSTTTTRGGNFSTTVGMNPYTGASFLPGVIDEVAVYDHVLYGARVAAHYSAGV